MKQKGYEIERQENNLQIQPIEAWMKPFKKGTNSACDNPLRKDIKIYSEVVHVWCLVSSYCTKKLYQLSYLSINNTETQSAYLFSYKHHIYIHVYKHVTVIHETKRYSYPCTKKVLYSDTTITSYFCCFIHNYFFNSPIAFFCNFLEFSFNINCFFFE